MHFNITWLGVLLSLHRWDEQNTLMIPPTYTTGWKEAVYEKSNVPENKTECPQPGLKPTTLDHC